MFWEINRTVFLDKNRMMDNVQNIICTKVKYGEEEEKIAK
jgi:hypothetical protein